MKQVLRFLRALALHNEKPWFDAHKAEYLQAKGTMDALAVRLIDGIRSFDDSIGPLSVADCTYRIYRDIRFSKDKTPYKTHIGIYITRGGKKSGYSGYYLHLDGSGRHMIAAGDIWMDPQVRRTLREDIELGQGDFRRILAAVAPELKLDMSDALKKVPKGFPADTPDSEFFKLKTFCLYGDMDDDFILSPDFETRVLAMFRSAKPFLDYINRAIDFCKEDGLLR